MKGVTSTSQSEEKMKIVLFTHVFQNPYDFISFMEHKRCFFLKNVPDHSMRAGGEGVFVAIDVWDTDIEEEIYQKGTSVLRQKNLQRIDVFKDLMFDTVRITFCKSPALLPSSIPVVGQGL